MIIASSNATSKARDFAHNREVGDFLRVRPLRYANKPAGPSTKRETALNRGSIDDSIGTR